jgi:hypothetical protein
VPRRCLVGAVLINASGQSIFYAIGGANSSNPALRRVEAYNVAAATWSTKTPMPTAREDLAAGTVKNAAGVLQILAVSGYNNAAGDLAVNEAYTP